MSEFLIRDDSKPTGYIIKSGPLSRTKEESYVPWAVTGDGRVVYALFEGAGSHGWRASPSKQGLRKYDATVSKERRSLCQSKLGMIALNNLDLSKKGLDKVSEGIRKFLESTAATNSTILADYQKDVGKYAYGMTYMSYGRFSDSVPRGNLATKTIWSDAINALNTGKPLAGVMNIHDNVPSKLLRKYDGEQGGLYKEYKKWTGIFRADAEGELFFDDDPNSRENKLKNKTEFGPGRGRIGGKPATPTTEGGMLPTGSGTIGTVQSHKRGVDMYDRKAPSYSRTAKDALTVRTKFSAISYYRDLDTRLELFGAGPSGTTGTLLASAMTFGSLRGEELKQYCLAIVAYLVGGGCHSLHESLTVMGYHPDLEYNSSSMLKYSNGRADSSSFPILPLTFLRSPLFPAWRDEFYDITVLGGIHWLLS